MSNLFAEALLARATLKGKRRELLQACITEARRRESIRKVDERLLIETEKAEFLLNDHNEGLPDV